MIAPRSFRGAWVGLIAAGLIGGCGSETTSNRCLVVSPNNSWSQFGVTQTVTSPSCPLNLPSVPYTKNFVADVIAPDVLPRTALGDYVRTAVYDVNNLSSGSAQAFWATTTGNKLKAHQSGSYFAGQAGAPAGEYLLEDYGITTFAVNTSVTGGEDTAQAYVILPYSCCSRPAIIAQNKFARANVQTTTQVMTSGLSSPQYAWYRDGQRFNPSYTLPLQQWTTDSTIVMSAGSAGTHTWRVDVKHGTWPNPSQTFSMTWTQTVAP